jgi:hypothetical protein
MGDQAIAPVLALQYATCGKAASGDAFAPMQRHHVRGFLLRDAKATFKY